MKLNKEHIAIIHDFVKSKYVDFYDVELELVDHLASSIEEKMKVKKELSFENALKETYQPFGLFGFSEFVEQKQNQVYRKGRSVFFKELIGFFKIPQIIITLLAGTFF